MSNNSKMIYMDCHTAPIELRGLAQTGENGVFCRLPKPLLSKLNDDINILAYHTSGAALRFRTSSPRLALRAHSYSKDFHTNMTFHCIFGFDIYAGSSADGKSRFVWSIVPTTELTMPFEGICTLPEQVKGEDGYYDVTIYFPLYNGVTELQLGIEENSDLQAPTPFTTENVVFYGSSITQGAAASRPGLCYTNILSRELDFGMTNLGFSGQAHGEPELAEYIGSIKMNAFVYDYDHNAPTPEFLEQTHYPFFEVFRKYQPNTPVIMVSRPDFETGDLAYQSTQRREIIRSSYKKAVESGDKNVYFIDGETLFGIKDRDSCTIDTVHPNDLGFRRMADVIGKVLKEVITL